MSRYGGENQDREPEHTRSYRLDRSRSFDGSFFPFWHGYGTPLRLDAGVVGKFRPAETATCSLPALRRAGFRGRHDHEPKATQSKSAPLTLVLVSELRAASVKPKRVTFCAMGTGAQVAPGEPGVTRGVMSTTGTVLKGAEN